MKKNMTASTFKGHKSQNLIFTSHTSIHTLTNTFKKNKRSFCQKKKNKRRKSKQIQVE